MAQVLIIDDCSRTLDLFRAHLTTSGHQVTVAETLAEGLEAVDSGIFEIVYLNPRMPDGNGLDWLARIAEKPSSPEVVILTGAKNPDEAERAFRQGAWDYV
jgi:two-component system, NtrC family, response regulator